MKYRKLRIFWAVVCGIVCLLLIVLWGLSFHYRYGFAVRSNSQAFIVSSQGGKFRLFRYTPQDADPIWSDEMGDRAVTFLSQEYQATDFATEWKVARRSFGFGWWFGNDLSDTIYIPYWFVLLLLSAVIASASWIQWYFHFSLRSLLIAMTLAAIALGAIVYAVQNT